MKNTPRRSISAAFFLAVLAPTVTFAARMGVALRFVIAEQRTSGERRTYQDTVIFDFEDDATFASDFDGEFNVSLRPTLAAGGVRVEVSVHDLRRAGAFAGEGTAVVALDGREAFVELSTSAERRYGVTLSATRRALPG
jgi:hypothetical protein